MTFIKPEPKTPEEKAEVVSDAMGGKNKTMGTLHRMEIEPADNGFMVHTTHKVPKAKTDKYGDTHDYDTSHNVFQDHDKMIGHIISNTKKK